MSSGDVIVKRRPSRPRVHPEPQEESNIAVAHHEEPHHEEPLHEEPHHEEPHHEHHHEEEDDAVPSRQTCKPSAVDAHDHGETESDDEGARTPPFAEEDGEEAAAAHDGHATTTPPPPQPIKTARPHDAKAKKATKVTKKAKKAKKEAATAPAAPTATASTAAPKKKKPTRRVNLANVEKQPPMPEGVNTPRSIAVCAEHGVHPSELAPYPKEHFQGAGVADEVAELRFHSYEKRRQARMAELLPAYRVAAKHSPRPQGKAAEAGKTAEAEDEEAEAEEVQRPTAPPTDEEAKMQQQFEKQHQRLLEQERRKANNGGYDNDGNRRASARASYARGTSPRAGAGSTSPGRYSVSTAAVGRPTVDQPYSAVKIYSSSIAEERPLTQSEAVMIEDINEREGRRLDTQERAVIIQENKQLMYVERELEKQRRTTANVQAKAHERERLQQELFKHTNDRQYEAAARRQRLEEERQAKLMESIAEKEGHVHANDPYASLLSRRRQSGSLAHRATSNPNEQPPEPAHEVEADEL